MSNLGIIPLVFLPSQASLTQHLTRMNLRQALSALAAFTIASAYAAEKYPDIPLDELKRAIAEHKVTLIDVNGTDSFRAGHIPGAIDFIAKESEIPKLLPKDKSALIVAYCSNEDCGSYREAADVARQLGYTNVKHFSAGIIGWKKAGEPVER
jgi:rhodanese-related sulfurtransferase